MKEGLGMEGRDDRTMMEDALAEVIHALRQLTLEAWFAAPWEDQKWPFES